MINGYHKIELVISKIELVISPQLFKLLVLCLWLVEGKGFCELMGGGRVERGWGWLKSCILSKREGGGSY